MEYVEKDHRLEENDLNVLADKVKNATFYEIIDRKKQLITVLV